MRPPSLPRTPSLAHGLGSGRHFSNWAGTAHARPLRKATPVDEAALAEELRRAEGPVRVVGAGHSFSPIAASDGVMLSLDGLRGIAAQDLPRARATIWAGTRLRELGPLLDGLGLALPNQGDIDHQSLGGAVGTGTHGTGAALGCLSAPVTAMRLMTADGDTLEVSAHREADVFRAAAVSLGVLGVSTQITMQCVPAYDLEESLAVMPAREAIAHVHARRTQDRHIELWLFPFGERAIVKRLVPTREPATTQTVRSGWDDDIPLWLSCQVPGTRLLSAVHKRLAWFVSDKPRRGRSYVIFPSERRVRFAEMEYQVPAERGPECLAEVADAIVKLGRPVAFPLEYRYVAGDDLMLSPFTGGPRASISVHQYHRAAPEPLFQAVEPIFLRHGGRPHWGKMHGLDARALRPLYPEWDAFQDLRRRLDPRGRFLTPALARLLGPA